jgi:hypothetical protein
MCVAAPPAALPPLPPLPAPPAPLPPVPLLATHVAVAQSNFWPALVQACRTPLHSVTLAQTVPLAQHAAGTLPSAGQETDGETQPDDPPAPPPPLPPLDTETQLAAGAQTL